MKLGKILKKSFHQSYLVVCLCLGIIIGMILGVIFRVNYFGSPAWLIVVILLAIWGYLRPKSIFLVIMMMVGMILAFFRLATELSGEDYVQNFWGQNITVSGRVKDDPNVDGEEMSLVLTDLSFGDSGNKVSGSIYIKISENAEISREDLIVLSGELMGGFGAYVGYMYKPVVNKIQKPEPENFVLKIRNWFANRIEGVIAEPQVRLGLSYLLGMKSNLPEELSENLRVVGLTHIVVASGAHLSILVEIARKFFGRISRFAGFLFSILFILFFMAMVGFTASILRAGIMSILTILAWFIGRKIEPWRLILLVVAGTLMINPMFLTDVGWLLSFASFAGIMILGPRIVEFFWRAKKSGFVAQTIITTISATIMTLPITLYYYGAISLISVVANLLILPTLPYAMGLTFLTGVVAGVPILETIVGFLATKLLDLHIFLVGCFSTMESLLVEIEPYNAKVFWLYVLILVPFLIGLLRRKMLKFGKRIILESLCQDIVNGQLQNDRKP